MLNFDVATSDCSSSSSGEAFAKPSSEAGAAASIEIFPAEAVKRQACRWYGMAAETVECAGQRGAEFRFSGPMHLLAISDRKLSFLPAGHAYHEWHRLSAHGRFVFVYFDPAKLQALDLKTPHLFIEDRMLVETALRLAVVVERASPEDQSYLEALGRVLVHELRRLGGGDKTGRQPIRGGLAGWQQRVVTTYIEDHLDEHIPLPTLAGLARLSPYHFSRAFKQSFGVPPHRYHIQRRIERAKLLLAKSAMSVTEVGVATGFSETSSFTSTFRRLTGITPSAYSRQLGEFPA
jgi:AraC family transcriptional regulator